MKGPDSGSIPLERFHRVDDLGQAGMLMDMEVRRYFEPFLAREKSVSEAAAEVGCDPSVMLYRVGRFVRAGLLRVVRERRRAGRAIKVYRSSHDAYLVPYASTAFATLEEAFAAGYEANARRVARLVARQFRQRSWDGYRLYRQPSGETWFEGAPDEDRMIDMTDLDRPPGLDYVIDVPLTEAEARQVQAMLVDILKRFGPIEERRERTDDKEHTPYMLSVAFVRAEVER
ncbi:MAG: hypothetical protein R6W77_01020 [Trueperaceae bacterium]